MKMTLSEIVGSRHETQPPAGWTLAAPRPPIFYSILEERRLSLGAALNALSKECTELQAPNPSERCFMLPYRSKGWLEYEDSGFENRSMCDAVRFLFDCDMGEIRDYEGREGEVLTVMPWRLQASIAATIERVVRDMEGATS